MPRVWTPNLGPILGRNLKDDETNLRYGVYILKHFAKRTADTLDAKEVIRIALLGYNGCVTGSNTPNCRAYPDRVRQHVDENAQSICSGRDFHECVALPLWAALRDTTTPSIPWSEETAPVDTGTAVVAPAPKTANGHGLSSWLGGIVTDPHGPSTLR